MTRDEMINLIEFISVVCPQQKIGRATAVPWYEIIGDLDFAAARNAVIAVKHSQAFVDPSDIIAEVKRAKSAKVYDRTAAQAIADSSRRELPAASAVPPTPEYLAAKADMDAGMRERAEQVTLNDHVAARRAEAWLDYKLSGKLPPQMPLSGPPAPRWVQLPGDPPELRNWLVRQSQDGTP